MNTLYCSLCEKPCTVVRIVGEKIVSTCCNAPAVHPGAHK